MFYPLFAGSPNTAFGGFLFFLASDLLYDINENLLAIKLVGRVDYAFFITLALFARKIKTVFEKPATANSLFPDIARDVRKHTIFLLCFFSVEEYNESKRSDLRKNSQ